MSLYTVSSPENNQPASSDMPAKKRSLDDPNESGKLDVYRDLEERVLKDAPAKSVESDGQPGRSIIEGALTARDTHLLRAIAAERKGLTDITCAKGCVC